ncbi:MAG: methyltransferase domain-containing protein [Thalassolituus maritimus]|nr:MAG: methyltransferase domain-containing protein [Thalassolituus maritimus]
MKDSASGLICPKCEQPLTAQGNQWQCPDRHSYDTAKQGYINLLLVNQKKSKNPGDDVDMVRARTAFLDSGIYEPISDALNALVKTGPVLDIGCGEGYYTHRLQQQSGCEVIGLDISREAIKGACRRTKDIRWLVASGARPPVSARSIKTIISLFTPLMPKGLDHALADDGEIITVNTGPQHLMQLREVIYDEVKAESFSPVAKMADARFIAVDEQKLTYEVTVPGGDPLVALFNMTPHRWKVSPERAEKLQTIDSLTLEIDVVLHRFRRQKDS